MSSIFTQLGTFMWWLCTPDKDVQAATVLIVIQIVFPVLPSAQNKLFMLAKMSGHDPHLMQSAKSQMQEKEI